MQLIEFAINRVMLALAGMRKGEVVLLVLQIGSLAV
jgi:hypothetical protein